VSTSTVSRVLSNAARRCARDPAQGMAAVQRLGYSPNATAKNLRMLRTRRLLVTVPRHLPTALLTDPSGHWKRPLTAKATPCSSATRSTTRDAKERYARRCWQPRGSGLIFLGRKLSKGVEVIVNRLHQAGAGRECSSVRAALGIPSVQIDNQAAGRRDDGSPVPAWSPAHRIVTGPAPELRQRTAAARPHAIARRRNTPNATHRDERRLLDRFGRGGRRAAARRKQPPTAIFLSERRDGHGCDPHRAPRKMRIPETCQSSASTTSATRGTPDPPLTTVAQPMRQMGEIAVRVLLICSPAGGATEQVTLPHTLVVRASTAPPGRW